MDQLIVITRLTTPGGAPGNPDHPEGGLRREQPDATGACLDAIIAHVARSFRLEAADLRAHKRGLHLDFCRHVAMYLCRRTGASSPAVGRSFGRCHASVLHGVGLIERRMEAHGRAGFGRLMEDLERRIAKMM